MKKILKNIIVSFVTILFITSSVGIDIYYHICGATGSSIVSLYYKIHCEGENIGSCTLCQANHSGHISDCCSKKETRMLNDKCSDKSKHLLISLPYIQSMPQDDAPEPLYISDNITCSNYSFFREELKTFEIYYKSSGKSPPIRPKIFIVFHSCSPNDDDDDVSIS